MKKVFRLEGLDCANCASKMERKVAKIKGVTEVSVNFMTAKMNIEFEENDMKNILTEAEKIIKKIESGVIIKEV